MWLGGGMDLKPSFIPLLQLCNEVNMKRLRSDDRSRDDSENSGEEVSNWVDASDS
jgi:hypothetical protein